MCWVLQAKIPQAALQPLVIHALVGFLSAVWNGCSPCWCVCVCVFLCVSVCFCVWCGVLLDQLSALMRHSLDVCWRRWWLPLAIIHTTPESWCASLQALIDVAEVFGESWTTAKAVPLVLRQLQEQFYLFRITCMQVWSSLN